MMDFAVIKTGGRQYRVQKGDILDIGKLKGFKEGQKIKFDQILLLKTNQELQIGKPYLSKTAIEAEVLDPGKKGPKVKTMKFKNKTRYLKRLGHHQAYTRIKILGLVT